MSATGEIQKRRCLGAHVSVAGGLLRGLDRACQLGCTALQLFAGNPRSWRGEPVAKEIGTHYRLEAARRGIRQTIIHAIYLVNLASPQRELRQKSLSVLRRDLLSADRLGAAAVVVHPGANPDSAAGEIILRASLASLISHIPVGCRILVENTACAVDGLGALARLNHLIKTLPPAIGICLDSAHLCGAGYDLAEPKQFSQMAKEINALILGKRVGCIHLNDSKQPCGSHLDRHENLGQGYVGRQGLINLLNYKPFQSLPFILETPGFDQRGPDLKNMRILRNYISKNRTP